MPSDSMNYVSWIKPATRMPDIRHPEYKYKLRKCVYVYMFRSNWARLQYNSGTVQGAIQ